VSEITFKEPCNWEKISFFFASIPGCSMRGIYGPGGVKLFTSICKHSLRYWSATAAYINTDQSQTHTNTQIMHKTQNRGSIPIWLLNAKAHPSCQRPSTRCMW
jgi:hypothetical protein